jgi:hypothetical protein
LHGNVPDSARVAPLLIDVINDFEFEGGEQLLELALPVGKRSRFCSCYFVDLIRISAMIHEITRNKPEEFCGD